MAPDSIGAVEMAPTEEQKVARLEIRTEHLEENHKEIRRTLETILIEQRMIPRKIGGRVKRAIKQHSESCKALSAAKKPEPNDGFFSLPGPVLQRVLAGLVVIGSLLGGGLHLAGGDKTDVKAKPAQIQGQEVKP